MKDKYKELDNIFSKENKYEDEDDITMKKYKVKIIRETYVDAKDEEDAKLMAYDSLIMGDVDFEIEEDDEDNNWNKKEL